MNVIMKLNLSFFIQYFWLLMIHVFPGHIFTDKTYTGFPFSSQYYLPKNLGGVYSQVENVPLYALNI